MENSTRTTSLCESYTTCTARACYLPAVAYILHADHSIKISFEIDEILFLKFYSAVHPFKFRVFGSFVSNEESEKY